MIVPALLSPFIAGGAAALGVFLAYRMIRRLGQREARTGYRYGQIFSASLVSLAHGTNDAQKTMGVISLALIANGSISATNFSVPLWVKLGCALSIALGTASGGWRIINTMGNRITNVESPQGFAAETASAATILASSYYGYPLSTTQVVSGGVLGAGLGKKAKSVHWNVIGQMVSAWVITMPGAGLLGGAAWAISDIFSPNVGAAVIVALAAVAAFTLWTLAQRNKITAADLDRTNVSVVDEAEAGRRSRRDRDDLSATMTVSRQPVDRLERPRQDRRGGVHRVRRGRAAFRSPSVRGQARQRRQELGPTRRVLRRERDLRRDLHRRGGGRDLRDGPQAGVEAGSEQ